MYLLKAQRLPASGPSPFVLKGSLGTSASFYSSNEAVYTRPSFAWNVYGNFIAKIDQVTMPFSFITNQYNNSREPVYIQAGASPTYKWAKLHIGDRYMQFSPLIFEGQNFRGVGLELNPGKFRFGAFYGRLNKAINEDTSQKSFRLPQYSRTGYGVKIGYGTSSGFIDLIYFHAKDDSSSASFVNPLSQSTTTAGENAVLGLSVKTTILKKLVLSADLAASGLTQDLSKGKGNTDSSENNVTKLMGHFVTHNATTVGNYAGQASVVFTTTGFNTNLGYRRVQPDFKSFGTPFVLNDVELLSWVNYFSLANGRVNINTSLSDQHNNLEKKLETELQTLTGSVFVNAVIGTNLNLNLGYYGYSFKNKAGILSLNDTNRMQQQISQITFNPSYNLAKGYKLHYISANINISWLDDKNRFTSPQTDSRNLSASLNYTLALANKFCSLSINGIYSRYKQGDTTSYDSYGTIVGASAQLLKSRSLNIQGNIGYILSHFNTRASQSNITYTVNASYRKRGHSFSLYGNYVYTPPNTINDRINKTIPYAVATKNLAGGVSYAYTF